MMGRIRLLTTLCRAWPMPTKSCGTALARGHQFVLARAKAGLKYLPTIRLTSRCTGSRFLMGEVSLLMDVVRSLKVPPMLDGEQLFGPWIALA